ncbi:MAG: substrate-binding domain-containing protein, partial [Beijerinckiaceae bacterium]
EGPPAPDVICYLNDHMAFGGMATCIKQGIAVPEDIGIAGFNDLEINAVLPLPITTVVTPRQQMGAIGARNLVARIHGAVVERSVVVPTHIREGRTTQAQSIGREGAQRMDGIVSAREP